MATSSPEQRLSGVYAQIILDIGRNVQAKRQMPNSAKLVGAISQAEAYLASLYPADQQVEVLSLLQNTKSHWSSHIKPDVFTQLSQLHGWVIPAMEKTVKSQGAVFTPEAVAGLTRDYIAGSIIGSLPEKYSIDNLSSDTQARLKKAQTATLMVKRGLKDLESGRPIGFGGTQQEKVQMQFIDTLGNLLVSNTPKPPVTPGSISVPTAVGK